MLNPKKELATYLLDKIFDGEDDINEYQYELLYRMINDMTSMTDLEITIKLLGKSYCFGDEINDKTLINEIKKEAQMNKLLFGE